MPTELLLPAFVLTLVANAILVAVAVRALLRARDDRDRAAERLTSPESRPPRTTVTLISAYPTDEMVDA